MPTTFVPAAASDVDLVLAFMAGLYHPIHWDEARARQALHDLLAHPESGGTWLIHAEGQPVGYLVLTICYSLEFHGRFVLLDELFVAEPYRGRGIGAQALAFAGEFCRIQGLRAIRLETAWQNSRAIELYRRAGFEVDPRHLMTRWIER